MSSATTYRDILLERFESRVSRNRAYSLRAYARDIGLSSTSLSLVLAGKQGISATAAENIAKQLALSAEESARFIDLALAEHARSARARELARIRLRRPSTTSDPSAAAAAALSLEAFRVISDWYHFAILELTEVEGFKSDVRWIAKSLGLGEAIVAPAIERLKKLDLLEEKRGRLRQTKGFLATPSGVPSDALKKFHTQLLERASQAMHFQNVDEREYAHVILPMNPADLDWARAEMKDFRRALMNRLESASEKTHVYCLGMQLFSLSTRPSLTGEKS